MRARIALSLVAALVAAGGCQVSAPPPASPQPVQLGAKRTTTPPPTARVALEGAVTAPPSLISTNGGTVVGNNGSSLIGNHSAGWRILAAEAWGPVGGATITLRDAHGQPLAGQAIVTTDAQGRFRLEQVPAGRTWVLEARAGALTLSSLARPETGKSALVPVDPATTLATAGLIATLSGRPDELAQVPTERFEALSRSVREALDKQATVLDRDALERGAATFEALMSAVESLQQEVAKTVGEAREAAQEAAKEAVTATGATPSPIPSPRATGTPAPTPTPTPTPAPPGTPPSLSGFAPARGAPGMRVTLTGSAFAATPAGNAVSLNGTPATVLSASPSQLVVAVPAGVASGPIKVVVDGQEAVSATPFEALAPGSVWAELALAPRPAKLTIAPDGAVWALDPGSDILWKLAPDDGRVLLTRAKVAAGPGVLAVDRRGDVWVQGDMTGMLMRLDPTSPPDWASAFSSFGNVFSPRGLAMDADGAIWVSSSMGTVQKLDGDTGDTLQDVTGLFSSPTRIVTAGNGLVYVLEEVGSRISKIRPDGGVTKLSVGNAPRGLGLGPDGTVWVASMSDSKLSRFNATGAPEGSFPVLPQPEGLAVGPDNSVWLRHRTSDHVTHYSPTGELLKDYRLSASTALDLVVDASGRAWVAAEGGKIIILAP